MTLHLELKPQTEAWINAEAKQLGLEPEQLALKLIDDVAKTRDSDSKPPISERNAAAIAMLQQWMKEDATDDPELLRAASEEVAEMKRNLNANRAATGERLVFFES